jgi:hypothetical protein
MATVETPHTTTEVFKWEDPELALTLRRLVTENMASLERLPAEDMYRRAYTYFAGRRNGWRHCLYLMCLRSAGHSITEEVFTDLMSGELDLLEVPYYHTLRGCGLRFSLVRE